jgi:hypothetical protein
MSDYNKYCTYDNQGNLLTQLKTDANTGDTLEMITRTYDSELRLTKRIIQVWNNGNWENSEQYYYEYDAHGNQTIFLYYFWQGSWVPSMGTKHIYIYENNKITEDLSQYWNQTNTMWVNTSKEIFTYDINGYRTERVYQLWDNNMGIWISAYKDNYMVSASGIVNEMITQEWDDMNSTWVNNLKYTNITWHQWNGDFYTSDLESITILNWNNGIWENYMRIECTWESNGSYVEIHQQYSNGNWVNSERQTYSYDDHGNFILWTIEFWMNNNWVIDMGTQFLLTYDGIDLIERIYQEWDHINSEWANWTKEEYSDFMHTQGFGDNQLAQYIHLYPNPTSGILYVEPEMQEAKGLTVDIVNSNGQVVFTKQIHSTGDGLIEIDLSGCVRGIYFVKLQMEHEIKVGKLILR